MPLIDFTYLSGPDVDRLAMTNQEILDAVEVGLLAQGRAESVLDPRAHHIPNVGVEGHFNVLRGTLPASVHPPNGVTGVKIVGDFVDNYRLDLPSEMSLLNLFDPTTGMPIALLDATAITAMRTGAVTALGAKYLARPDSKVVGHIGARGSAEWNVRLLAHLFDLKEVRIHSRRPESRQSIGERMAAELTAHVAITDNWESCLKNADILVEASRLTRPEPLLKTAWVNPGATVIPYGTMSAVEDDLTDVMDQIVMDDWEQAKVGPFGALRSHYESGKLKTAEYEGVELGKIVAGICLGRRSENERILFWHRGLALSDIALGSAMLAKAQGLGIGQTLSYA